MDVMEDWLDELEGALTLTADPVGFLQGSLHLMRCYIQRACTRIPAGYRRPSENGENHVLQPTGHQLRAA
jgi:hypothetical protein